MQTKAKRSPDRSPPHAGARRRPMRRTTDDRVWVGVAGGVAERLSVDAVIVRAGFVVASAVWGFGLALYLGLWVLLPELDSPTRNVVKPGVRPTRFRGAALVAIVLGVLYVLRSWAILPPDRYLWPWLLITVGVVVLWARDPLRPLPRPALMAGPANSLLTDVDFAEPDPDQHQDASGPLDDKDSMGSGSYRKAASDHSGDEDATGSADFGEAGPGDAHRHEPSLDVGGAEAASAGSAPALVPIGTLTIGSLLVTCGMLYLLDDAGLLDVSWRLVGGVALTVIGVALVAGGWWGRPRGLIVAGTLICVFLLVATVLQVPLSGGVGRRDIRPFDVQDVSAAYELAVGSVVLDLSDVDIESRQEVTMTVAAGELRVIIPLGVDVVVDARVGFGEVVVFDKAGTGVGVTRKFTSDGAAEGVWVLDLDVGVGKLLVEQVP